ncbi:MAG: NUDIX hydrolase [Hydrogenophaga sp.]|uniref:NUDIX hydrolase n=1 Tax=Hydrogenophaga sp. TaxID=1904254 RepID=UPI003D0B1BD9
MTRTDSKPTPTTLRAASTLILLRDSEEGPQVLMLKRHGLSDVLAGAFVFPGGKLDASDAELKDTTHLDESPQALHLRLGENDIDAATAVGLYVAALRETFEESGLLLAEDLAAERAEEALARQASGMPFNALLAEMRLRLRVGALAPWSRWVTPPDSPNKRFDTRFFVARAPDGLARHDERETTEARWVKPRPALQSYWDGELTLAPPQIMTLAHLARHTTVDSVLSEARGRLPVLIQPHVIRDPEGRTMCYPGDELHPVRERAMPGPLRLFTRGQRYEPQDGFEGFFSPAGNTHAH